MDAHGVNPSPILPPLGGGERAPAGPRAASPPTEPATPAAVQIARIMALNAFQPGKSEAAEALAPRRSGPVRGGGLDIYA